MRPATRGFPDALRRRWPGAARRGPDRLPRPAAAWEVAALYVGSVVGAGFASGREVVQFFAVHGVWGLLGAGLAAVGFLAAGSLVLGAATRLGSASYRELLGRACGPRAAAAVELLLLAFSWAGLSVMLAGAGAAARQVGLPFALGAWGTLGAVWFCLRRRLSGVLAANRVLVPLLTAILLPILCAGLARWLQAPPSASTPAAAPAAPLPASPLPLAPAASLPAPTPPGWPRFRPVLLPPSPALGLGWAASAVLYVGYNSLVALVALAPLGRTGCRRRAWAGPAGAAAWLGGLLALECAATLALGPGAWRDLPVALLAQRAGPVASALYLVALWCSLFTTALAFAWGLEARLGPPGGASGAGSPARRAGGGWSRPAMLCLLASAAALAHSGFGRLVALVYPASGYLGAAVLGLLLMRFPRRAPPGASAPHSPRITVSGEE
ncbi:MAG: hypothetical protein K6T75_04665 [Acetobacteraceae bacterium]|nr:hypothetical protein [Acetobacteraceae bacterium]